MRLSLLYNPYAIIDRLAVAGARRQRRKQLKGTPAAALGLGHLDSLELLNLLNGAPPSVIYDVGANVGTWTCLAKSIFPNARVEAFEPLPAHWDGFKKWTSPWNEIRLHSCALGRSRGTANLHVMDFSDASSLLPLSGLGRDEFKIKPSSDYPVTVVPLDELVREENLPTPDLIKLDVQGFELEVLLGAEECLRMTRAVLCEVSFAAYYSGQPLFSDILSHMEKRGFKLHAFGAGTALGAPLVQADALFLRKE